MTQTILLLTLVLGGDSPPVPHLPDETSLLAVKADPERYLEKEIIICGGVRLADYYNYYYGKAQLTHYSINFTEFGKDATEPGEDAYLYLPKDIGKGFVDYLVEFEKKHAGQRIYRREQCLVRVKVKLLAAAYADGRQWDILEALDVQCVESDFKSWKPWVVEAQLAERAAAEEKARKEAEAARREAEAARKEAEYRTWTDATGQFKVVARLVDFADGKAILERKNDGRTVSIPASKLSKEDQAMIRTILRGRRNK